MDQATNRWDTLFTNALVFDGTGDIPLRFRQRLPAVHHSGARALAELLHQLRARRHRQPSTSAAATSDGSASTSDASSASSLVRVPRPSLIASARRPVVSRTARIASSLPGTG